MEKLNINQHVYFQLTEKGEQVFEKHRKTELFKIHEENIYELAISEVMRAFGSSLHMGAEFFVRGNFYFSKEELLTSLHSK